jgi:hypothetical protein
VIKPLLQSVVTGDSTISAAHLVSAESYYKSAGHPRRKIY